MTQIGAIFVSKPDLHGFQADSLCNNENRRNSTSKRLKLSGLATISGRVTRLWKRQRLEFPKMSR
jgi:hypothetical protein